MSQRNDFKAGLFIVISIVLIIGIVIGIKGLETLTEAVDVRTVTFTLKDDVGGLAVGDAVRLGGVRVGSVRDVSFISGKDGAQSIVIGFTIPRKFEVRQGARMTVQTTITGTSVLNIVDLGAGPVLAANEPIEGHASGLSSLLAGIGDSAPALLADIRTQTLPKINAAVDGFRETGPEATKLVRHVDAKVDPMVDQYNRLTNKGTEMAGNISDMFGDTKTDFRTTIANLSAATGTVKDKLPPVMEKLDSGLVKINDSLDSAKTALEDIKASMVNAREATGSIRGIFARNRGKIDGMIASLKTAGDNLKNATAEIRRSPWRLLYKPAPNEMANLNLYDSARQFAEGAASLSDAATALRDASQDEQVDPETLRALMQKLDTRFAEFGEVEQKLWESVR